LGKAYYTLWRNTREHGMTGLLPRLTEIRQAQIAGALNTALRHRLPSLYAQQAHQMLEEVYANHTPQFLDLIAKHRRQRLRLAESAGPPPGADAKAFTQEVERMSKAIEKLEQEVERRKDQYVLNTANKPALQKVLFAQQQGLSETALDVVLNDPEWRKLFEDERSQVVAGNVMFDLFLDTGRLEELQYALGPNEGGHGDQFVALHRNGLIRRAAVLGDYAEADRYLAGALPPDRRPGDVGREEAASFLGAFLMRQAQLATGMSNLAPFGLTAQRRLLLEPLVNWPVATLYDSISALEQLSQEAEIYLRRGWLALEAGQTVEAQEYLRQANALTMPPQVWGPAVFRLAGIMSGAMGNQFTTLARTQAQMQELMTRYRDWLTQAARQ
jgi:hypothetical protein